MAEWISVTDRLPDVVWAFGSVNHVLAMWKKDALADNLCNPNVTNTIYLHQNADKFSHWMPLPPPPDAGVALPAPAQPSACPECGGSLRTWKCLCTPIWPGYTTSDGGPSLDAAADLYWRGYGDGLKQAATGVPPSEKGQQ